MHAYYCKSVAYPLLLYTELDKYFLYLLGHSCRVPRSTIQQLYCKTQKKRYIKLSSEFREVVGYFNWPDDVTLEIVEQFRQQYACHYKLRECAMMVAEIRPCSFIVTWYVPESVAEKLKTNVPENILRRYSATQLDIDGCCVFHIHKPKVC